MYPWGAPPRVSSRGPRSPRDVSLPINISQCLGKIPRALDVAHSMLFRCPGQDGELATVDCTLLRADRDPVRHVEDPPPPPDGQGMSARHVPAMHP